MSNIALNLLRPTLANHEVIIFISEQVGKKGGGVDAISLLEQKLPCELIFPMLEALGKPLDGSYYTFKQVEEYDGIPISTPTNINNEEGINRIKEFAPDLIIAIRYGQIFKEEIISIPKHGIINLHSGILPDYKGILSTFQAMLNDEKQAGCTLHYITDPSIDTGSIINLHTIPIDKNKPLIWHVSQLYNGGIKMLENAIDSLAVGKPIAATTQDTSKGKYSSYPNKAELDSFYDKGYKLFDSNCYMEIMNLYFKKNK